MRLLVGLGNPGRKYSGTPHNLGFEVLDLLVQRHGLRFRSSAKFDGLIAEGTLADDRIAFLKPTTYMNLSGESVSLFLRYHPVEPADTLVITDDINLPMGRVRFRERGSHGGHKGLLSIIQHLGTEDFPRLRIGIYPQEELEDYVGFVLTPIFNEERALMEEMKILASEAVEYYLLHGFSKAAERYNGVNMRPNETKPEDLSE